VADPKIRTCQPGCREHWVAAVKSPDLPVSLDYRDDVDIGVQVLLSLALVVLAIATLLPGRRPPTGPRSTGRTRSVSRTPRVRTRTFRAARRTGPGLKV